MYQDLSLIAGSNLEIDVTFPADTDLSNKSAFMQVRAKATSTTAAIDLDSTNGLTVQLDPPAVLCRAKGDLTSIASGTYLYDILLVDDTDDTDRIVVAWGKLVVSPAITRLA